MTAFLVICAVISICTGFALFSRGTWFRGGTIGGIMSLFCIGFIIYGFIALGWKTGLIAIPLTLIGLNIGRAIAIKGANL